MKGVEGAACLTQRLTLTLLASGLSAYLADQAVKVLSGPAHGHDVCARRLQRQHRAAPYA